MPAGFYPAPTCIAPEPLGVAPDGHHLKAMAEYNARVRAYNAMADSLTGLRPDGRLVVMGLENKALPVHPGDLIARRIRILGSQQNGREYLYEALQIAAAGKVKVMAETYSLDEITQAYERVAEGKVRFRAVITPGN